MIPGEKNKKLQKYKRKATHRMDLYKGSPLTPLNKGLSLSRFKASLCDTYCIHFERCDLTLIISKSTHKEDRQIGRFGNVGTLVQIRVTSPGLMLSQQQHGQRSVTCIQHSLQPLPPQGQSGAAERQIFSPSVAAFASLGEKVPLHITPFSHCACVCVCVCVLNQSFLSQIAGFYTHTSLDNY